MPEIQRLSSNNFQFQIYEIQDQESEEEKKSQKEFQGESNEVISNEGGHTEKKNQKFPETSIENFLDPPSSLLSPISQQVKK